MTHFAVGISCAVNALGDIPPETQRPATNFRSDADLEAAIAAAMDRMCKAPERAEKMQHWREMCRLIDMRTPLQIFVMERQMGLLR